MANLKPVVTSILFTLGIICCLPLISVAATEEETASPASATGSAFPSLPERRKEQFQTSFGYALFPTPTIYPASGASVLSVAP
jgi:hypothetical protein